MPTPIHILHAMTTAARLLLVEDDPADARLVLDALADLHLGDHILVIPDGLQALEYLYACGRYRGRPPGHPAVILLDINLPHLDGHEVLTQIRADPVLRCIPVVMLTASNQDSDLSRAYALGANGYLVKTIDFASSNAALMAFTQSCIAAKEPPLGLLRSPHSPTPPPPPGLL